MRGGRRDRGGVTVSVIHLYYLYFLFNLYYLHFLRHLPRPICCLCRERERVGSFFPECVRRAEIGSDESVLLEAAGAGGLNSVVNGGEDRRVTLSRPALGFDTPFGCGLRATQRDTAGRIEGRMHDTQGYRRIAHNLSLIIENADSDLRGFTNSVTVFICIHREYAPCEILFDRACFPRDRIRENKFNRVEPRGKAADRPYDEEHGARFKGELRRIKITGVSLAIRPSPGDAGGDGGGAALRAAQILELRFERRPVFRRSSF